MGSAHQAALRIAVRLTHRTLKTLERLQDRLYDVLVEREQRR